jgi:hypothetical protein
MVNAARSQMMIRSFSNRNIAVIAQEFNLIFISYLEQYALLPYLLYFEINLNVRKDYK